jgi:hypothetical protein
MANCCDGATRRRSVEFSRTGACEDRLSPGWLPYRDGGPGPRQAGASEGRLQRVDDEFGAHVIGHGPAHDPAAVGVLDGSEVDPALPGPQVGDLSDPEHVRRRGPERRSTRSSATRTPGSSCGRAFGGPARRGQPGASAAPHVCARPGWHARDAARRARAGRPMEDGESQLGECGRGRRYRGNSVR